jgi:hypothetical protein
VAVYCRQVLEDQRRTNGYFQAIISRQAKIKITAAVPTTTAAKAIAEAALEILADYFKSFAKDSFGLQRR